MLTANQKTTIVQVVSFGCDETTACDFVGCTPNDITDQAAADEEFRRDLRRAEASAEVKYMKVVHDAMQDAKNWRAATWWFERREAQRQPKMVRRGQLQNWLTKFTTALNASVADQQVRQPLAKLLDELSAVVGK